MMQPFVVLFLPRPSSGVWSIRRTGWLPLALLWFAILLQTHMIGVAAGCSLAHGAALRAQRRCGWRDLGYSCLALAVVFFPYLLWELVTKFSDIAIIQLHLGGPRPASAPIACIDNASWNAYLTFLPIPTIPNQATFTSSSLVPQALDSAVLVGNCLAVLCYRWASSRRWPLSLYWWRKSRANPRAPLSRAAGDGQAPELGRFLERREWRRWLRLMPPPAAAGLLLLCAWQLLPPLVLVRAHAADLYPLLAGGHSRDLSSWPRIFSTERSWREWLSRSEDTLWLLARASLLYSVTLLLPAAANLRRHGLWCSMMSAGASTVVTSMSTSSDLQFDPERLSLNSTPLGATASYQTSIRSRGISRTRPAMYYFSRQLHTPVTVFDDERCLVLPNPGRRPGPGC